MVCRRCQIERFSREMRSIRVASRHRRLIYAWTQPRVVEALLPKWDDVTGKLKQFKRLFSNSKILGALSDFVGKIRPDAVRDFIAKGKKTLKQLYEKLRLFLTTPAGVPTLKELVKRTVVGAGIEDFYEEHVAPRVESLEEFLDDYLPSFKRAARAAAFAFIWINTPKVDWAADELVNGFTGQCELSQLLANLPESAVGFLSRMFGVRLFFMPVRLAARIYWLQNNAYLEWEDGWKPNWKLVDPERFRNAERFPYFDQLKVAHLPRRGNYAPSSSKRSS